MAIWSPFGGAAALAARLDGLVCHRDGMTDSDTRRETKRAIAADASVIFDLVRSPQGHVAIDSSGMLMSSTGDPATAVGDTFTIHMDRESLNDFPLGLYDVVVRITKFEQDRVIEWTIDGALDPPIGHVYGYELEPIDEGTIVTSYYDWSNIHPQYAEMNIFPVMPDGVLGATLGILARTVAPGKARPTVEGLTDQPGA